MPTDNTVARTPVSLDREHYDLLLKLQADAQAEEKKHISLSEVMRRALRAFASSK